MACVVFSVILCDKELAMWFGIGDNQRWIIGLADIVSFLISAQIIAELVYHKRKLTALKKRVSELPFKSQLILKNLVEGRKQTFHINKTNDRRIAEHLGLVESDDGFVSFPDDLWSEIKKIYTPEYCQQLVEQ